MKKKNSQEVMKLKNEWKKSLDAKTKNSVYQKLQTLGVSSIELEREGYHWSFN